MVGGEEGECSLLKGQSVGVGTKFALFRGLGGDLTLRAGGGGRAEFPLLKTKGTICEAVADPGDAEFKSTTLLLDYADLPTIWQGKWDRQRPRR